MPCDGSLGFGAKREVLPPNKLLPCCWFDWLFWLRLEKRPPPPPVLDCEGIVEDPNKLPPVVLFCWFCWVLPLPKSDPPPVLFC